MGCSPANESTTLRGSAPSHKNIVSQALSIKSQTNEARLSQRFKDRFKGRISHISKEGDYGVVANARLPIQKLQ